MSLAFLVVVTGITDLDMDTTSRRTEKGKSFVATRLGRQQRPDILARSLRPRLAIERLPYLVDATGHGRPGMMLSCRTRPVQKEAAAEVDDAPAAVLPYITINTGPILSGNRSPTPRLGEERNTTR